VSALRQGLMAGPRHGGRDGVAGASGVALRSSSSASSSGSAGWELPGVDEDELLRLDRPHARDVVGTGPVDHGERGCFGLHGGPYGAGGDR
jgi:hypothetical protein